MIESETYTTAEIPATLPDGNGGFESSPNLLIEDELIRFLRIPHISKAKNYHNAIANLKRYRNLPCIHIRAVRVFSKDEFERILAAARSPIWKARILLAKTAGLRRGEVLNLTLSDIDFAGCKVFAQPKEDSQYTWRWVVKDKDRRELPLVDEVAQLLIDLQTELPEGQPYLLLPPRRYQYLMRLKASSKLRSEVCKCPDGNFGRSWKAIFKKAAIEDGTFHDLRSNCITEWLEKGLMPHEVKELAGHADIKTTMNYYVGIRESLIDKARDASSAALGEDSSAHFVRAIQKGTNIKKQATSKTSQAFALPGVTQTLGDKALRSDM